MHSDVWWIEKDEVVLLNSVFDIAKILAFDRNFPSAQLRRAMPKIIEIKDEVVARQSIRDVELALRIDAIQAIPAGLVQEDELAGTIGWIVNFELLDTIKVLTCRAH